MAQAAYTSDEKAESSATQRTLFPSRKKWEELWEKKLDLRALRANSRLEVMAALFEDPRHKDAGLTLDREAVNQLISELGLTKTKANQLLDDTMLIGGWYYLPRRRARLRFDDASALKVLKQAVDTTSRLLGELGTDAYVIDALLHRDLDSEEAARVFDIHKLVADLITFTKAADRVLECQGTHEGGRRRDSRRNITITLITEAVEDASGTQVKVSRRDNYHFASAAGRYVRDVMRLLGWKDERVLVQAFEKLRRQSRVK